MGFARRSEAAETDLRSIAFEIAYASRRAALADAIIDELISQCEKLAEYSSETQLGTTASELGDGIRLFSHKRWVIIFRYQPHGIDVLRIADGCQAYPSWVLSTRVEDL